MLLNSAASVSAVPVMPASLLYMRKKFWKVMRGEGLVLALDFDVFLGFDGLMEPIAPAAAGHQAAGELIDDDDLAFLHHDNP